MKKTPKKKLKPLVVDSANIEAVVKGAVDILSPIIVKFYLNGEIVELKTESILDSFRTFPIDPKTLKGQMRIEASYKGGKPFGVILNIPKTRTFIVNGTTKELLAKRFNIALGIH